MIIWVVSDGKPGHTNQTLGLVQALQRQANEPVESILIDLSETKGVKNWAIAFHFSPKDPKWRSPDFIIAAGHKTHIPTLLLAKKWKAKSILCMKSSLPTSFFDANIIPYHDFMKPHDLPQWEAFTQKINQKSGLYPTLGAMHRVLPNPRIPKSQKLILIGGPSKNFGWDTDSLISSLQKITQNSTQDFYLTTSRRTPAEVIPALEKTMPPHVHIFPVEKTDRDWVPQHLEKSSEVWVTQDSVSMMFEALGSGARVGLLTVPNLNPTSKVNLGIDLLIQQNYVLPFSTWDKKGWDDFSPKTLLEADRIARQLLTDFHYPLKEIKA